MLDVGALYAEHERAIWGYVYRRLKQTMPDEIDDVAASIWERAWARRHQYQDRGLPPMAWVYKIARSAVVDHTRRLEYRQQTVPVDLLEWKMGTPDRLPSDYAHVHDAFRYLSPEQGQAVRLRYLEGYSIADAASEIGVSIESVKKLSMRGIDNLRRALSCEFADLDKLGVPTHVSIERADARAVRMMASWTAGLSYAEIAREFGVSRDAVKHLLTRARKRNLVRGAA